MAGACVLPDGESFSLRARDAATDACGSDEVVFGNLHAAVQCEAPDAGVCVCGTLQGAVVDGSDDIYLRVVCDYVHLNPVRAGLVATYTNIT